MLEKASVEITFREYEKGDLERCCEIAVNAWPEIFSIARSGEAKFAMEAYVDFYRASSSWQEVACESGSVVGLLFGKLEKDFSRCGKLRAFIEEQIVYLRVLSGLYGNMPHRFLLTRKAMSDDRNKAQNSPDADGEIVFFVVDRDSWGRGIGRELMGRFMRHARGRGARRIIVYTNDPGCNWSFYDKYGFKLRSTFRDNFTSYVRNEEVKALIFSIDL